MMGMDFMQMTPTERIITILAIGGVLLIALIADRISKWKQNKKK